MHVVFFKKPFFQSNKIFIFQLKSLKKFRCLSKGSRFNVKETRLLIRLRKQQQKLKLNDSGKFC